VTIASLPMYANTRTEAAYDRFWQAWSNRLRNANVNAPDQLTKHEDSEVTWTDPDLIVSQTCGFPYASRLRGKVRLIATPHYDVEGCDGPNYCSWLIVNTDNPATGIEDLRNSRAAYNGPGSQSGYNSFRAIVAPHANGKPFFAETICSGGHNNSMHMVADGRADCATVDAVSWELTLEETPDLEAKLRRVSATPSLPGLPFITAGSRSDAELATLRTTLDATLTDPGLVADLQCMKLITASIVPDDAYDACLEMEQNAIAAGYPVLA